MAKRKSGVGLFAAPIKINGQVLTNLFYSNISPEPEIKDIIVYENKNGSFNVIAKTGKIEKDWFPPGITDEDLIETSINSIFEDIKCPACLESFPASNFTESKLGKICVFCWKKMNPQPEWISLNNITSYIKEENK